MAKVIHCAIIDQATEGDNQEWATLICDPDDRIDDPEYTSKWEHVNCKRCLKRRGDE